jgi:hypothetical protein
MTSFVPLFVKLATHTEKFKYQKYEISPSASKTFDLNTTCSNVVKCPRIRRKRLLSV